MHQLTTFLHQALGNVEYNDLMVRKYNIGIFEIFSWYTKKRDENRGFYRKIVLKALLLMPYSEMTTLIYNATTEITNMLIGLPKNPVGGGKNNNTKCFVCH